jgi:transposase
MRGLLPIISPLGGENMEQLFCGLDIHKEKYTGCIMDAKGKVVREKEFPARREAVERFVTGIPNTHLTVAVEACGMWRPTYKNLTTLGYKDELLTHLKSL